jgi:hypothetical protein
MLVLLEALSAPSREPNSAGTFDSRLAALFNVRYVLTPFRGLDGTFPRLATFPGDALAGAPAGTQFTIGLYRHPEVLPRAFMVPEARMVRGDGQVPALARVLALLRAPGFDPKHRVLIDRAPGEPDVGWGGADDRFEGRVEFLAYEPHRVRVKVEASRAGWLFLGDTYYPGWRAWVGEREVPVYPANIAGRAVAIPPGVHHVVFAYRPASVTAGLVGTGVGLVALFTWVLAWRRRRQGHSSTAPGGPGPGVDLDETSSTAAPAA